MAYRPRNRSGDKAVGILATTAVVVGGALSLTVIITSVNANLSESFGIIIGAVVAVGLLFWLLRDKPKKTDIDNDYGWMLWRKPKKKKVIIRVKRAKAALANNEPPAGPPTAEGIRKLKGTTETWVPAANSDERDSQSRNG